jgi:hypothetical protein
MNYSTQHIQPYFSCTASTPNHCGVTVKYYDHRYHVTYKLPHMSPKKAYRLRHKILDYSKVVISEIERK